MKKYVLTVTINPALDKTVFIPAFRTGHDFRTKKISLVPGGKGINVSQVLKHLRTNTLATGFLGGRDGQYINQLLRKYKIANDFCWLKDNSRTSLTIIDPKGNKITRVLEPGPKAEKSDLARFHKKYKLLLKNASSVIISGHNVPGAANSFYADLIKTAKKNNVFTVLDASGASLEIGLRQKPLMIKPNLQEAEQFIGFSLKTVKDIKNALYLFYRDGITITAITLGHKGAIVFNGKEMLFVRPPKIKRINPVGCGDSFIAGFVANYLRHKSFSECARMATACGTANALSIDPGHIQPGIIRNIYKEIKIIKLRT